MMRTGILNDIAGERVGAISENEDGNLVGEGVGERLLAQAPLKSFDDWISTLHHSAYLRIIEATEDQAG